MSSTTARPRPLRSRGPLRLSASTRARADADGRWLPVSVAISSRLLVWAAAVGALALFGVRGIGQAPSWSAPFASQAANFVVAPALRWDSGWYLSIAHGGYFSAPATAFFPLYPLLLKAGGVALGSDQVAGLVISLAATIVSLYLLYVLAELELGRRTARTSVLLLAFFPTALFLSAVYTEALFLALSLGMFLAARRERWMWAAVLAGFASATRSTGVLLVLPLAWLYLYGPRSGGVARSSPRRWMPRFRLERSAGWLALAPAGLIAYMTYLGITHGTPLGPFQAEQYWAREFAGPFGAVFAALVTLPTSLAHIWNGTQWPLGPRAPLGWQTYQLIDLPFLAFALAGLWLCWRKLPTAYLAYAALALAEALSYPVSEDPLKSFSRYLLVIFPLFIAWGAYLAERRLARRVMLVACGLGLAGFSALWGVWAWVA